MSIKINGEEFLSYEEQVLKNKQDIKALAELLNTKVQATFLSTAAVEAETQIAKSTIATNQGVPKIGDLVIGTDGFIAKIISIGETIIEISTSLPVLNYMNAVNVAFNGFGTEYLTTDANVQAALARLDSVLLTTIDDAAAHYVNKSNPHEVTKAQVGLGNVDNTSDADKPVSIAQAAADAAVVNYADEQLDLKENLSNKKGVLNDSTTEYPNSAIVKSELAKKVEKFLNTPIVRLNNKTLIQVFEGGNVIQNSKFDTADWWNVSGGTLIDTVNKEAKVISATGDFSALSKTGILVIGRNYYTRLTIKAMTGNITLSDSFGGTQLNGTGKKSMVANAIDRNHLL